MPQTLNIKVTEESTVVITCAFTDEDDTPVAPVTLSWSLTDQWGNIINANDKVSVATPTSSEDVVLTGDDLAIIDEDKDQKRVFTVFATYNSSAGSGLHLKDSVWFDVEELKAESS